MERTSKPVVAGILIIITGSLGLMAAFSGFFFLIAIGRGIEDYYLVFPEFFTAFSLAIIIISALFSLLVLVSGLYTLERKYWGLALAGSIVAAIGFFVLGVPALVLIALSRDEFDVRPAQ
jgi:hypothetical protein